MLSKEPNNLEGLQKIVNLKASLNWGLSNNLKIAFPNTIFAIRPITSAVYTNIQFEWIAGFCSG